MATKTSKKARETKALAEATEAREAAKTTKRTRKPKEATMTETQTQAPEGVEIREVTDEEIAALPAAREAAVALLEAPPAETGEAEAPAEEASGTPDAAPNAADGAGRARKAPQGPGPTSNPAGRKKFAPPAALDHPTEHDAPDHLGRIRYVSKAADARVVGELHRTRSRHTKSLIVTVRTTDAPRWLDETRGLYAAFCADHGYVEYYPTRAKMFEDWTRPTYCPVCQHYTTYGERMEGDSLAPAATAEPEPEGEGDSEVLTPPSPVGAEAGGAETTADGEGEAADLPL
jgi:hypothetical protein